ncbi:MAG: alpha/beta hydrolase family protein [Pararhodobacter sp.]
MPGLSLQQLGTHGALYGPREQGSTAAAGLPGVVLLHGAEGPMAGWSHRFAAILAAHGYLALAAEYGSGDLFGAGPIRDVPLPPVLDAGRALAAHPQASGRVGLFGWSKGGEAALILAALMGGAGPFACVAAHAPTGLVTGAFDPVEFRAAMAGGTPRLTTEPDGPRAWVWAGKDSQLAPGARIPVEDCAVPLFLSHGTADPIVPVARTQALAERLAAVGRPADLMIAEGQAHGFDFDTEPLLWVRLLAFMDRYLRAA